MQEGRLQLSRPGHDWANSSNNQIDAHGSSLLECGGLTLHRAYVNHRCSNRLSHRDETVYWSAVSSHRKWKRRQAPALQSHARMQLTDRCLPNS